MLRSLLSDVGRSGAPSSAEVRGARLSSTRRMCWAGSVILGLLLSGCSRVPDAVNPVEWYKGTVRFFAGEDKPDAPVAKNGTVTAERGQLPPGADRPFPNLSEVPERPRTSGAAERQQVVEGLVADRDAARYSSEVVRRQSEVVNALPPPGSAVAARAPVPRNASAPVAVPPPPPPPQVAAALPAPPVPEPSMASPPPPPPTIASQPVPRTTAALPAPAPTPSPAPIPAAISQQRPPASVDETFRARLAQQQQLPAEAARNSLDTAGGFGPLAAVDFDTVVVSSEGVRTGVGSQGASAAPRNFATAPTAPTPSIVTDTAGEGGVKVATIVFGDGSSKLSTIDTQILRSVSAIYRERGGRVFVVGHASSRTRTVDSARHRQINQQLSAARANAVSNALISLGIPRNAIVVSAKADTTPMYYEVMPSGEAGNRRAEIFIDS